jgi:hypothetical protein
VRFSAWQNGEPFLYPLAQSGLRRSGTFQFRRRSDTSVQALFHDAVNDHIGLEPDAPS